MLSKANLWNPRLAGFWVGLVFALADAFSVAAWTQGIAPQLTRLTALACVIWWLLRPRWGFWAVGAWVLLQTFPSVPIPSEVGILVSFTFAGIAGYRRNPYALSFVLATTPVTWLLGGDLTGGDLVLWPGLLDVTSIFAWNGRIMEERNRATEERLKVVRRDAYLTLAEHIHHTSARELTRVLMQSQQLQRLFTQQDQWDESAKLAFAGQLQSQEEQARAALVQARKAIEVFRAGPPELSPLQLREEIRTHLRALRHSKGIEVDLEEPAWTFDEVTSATLKMILDEVFANLEKYAQPGSTATLALEEGQDAIMLTQSNLLAHTQPSAELSSGAGLELVAHRIEAMGGTLTYRIRSGQWILTATIPTTPYQKPTEE